MPDVAPCAVCRNKQRVDASSGRMVSHLNAQHNPCPGSYNVVPPSRIEHTGEYDHLVGGSAAAPAPASLGADLGVQVMPPLDENARPYPGTESRGDSLRLHLNSPPFEQEQDAVAEVAGVHAPVVRSTTEGDRFLFVPRASEPVRLDPARYCGVFGDDDGHPNEICLSPKGPHEHVWTPFEGPRFTFDAVLPAADPEEGVPREEGVDPLDLPVNWARKHGIRIADANGWRNSTLGVPPRSFDEPVTEGEFLARAMDSTVEPLKLRDEHDQPLPAGDETQADVQSMVIADIEARRRVGIERYGQALRTFNGRNTLRDLYEELLDATVYARSVLESQAASRDRLIEVVYDVICGTGKAPVMAYEMPLEDVARVIVDSIIDTLTK